MIPLFFCVYGAASLLTDAEDLRAADGAHPLGRRSSILHGDRLRTLDFPLGATLYTICLHIYTSFLALQSYVLL